MTGFLRPGVYTSETLFPLSQSINGIPGEAVAAFANTYNMGPTIPVFCSSWAQFTTLYGNFSVANQNALHFAVYSYFANGGSGCWVLRVPNTDALSASLVTEDIETPTAQNLITWVADAGQQTQQAGYVNVGATAVGTPGAWGNNIYVACVAVNTSHVNVIVYYNGTAQSNIVEQWLNVSANPGDPRYIASIINSPTAGSNYITANVSWHGGTYVAGMTDIAPFSASQLTGGSDGTVSPSLATSITSMFDQYVQQQIINMNIPGNSNAGIINSLISWAAGREDVFIVADGPAPNFPESSAAVTTNYVNLASGGASFSPSSFVGVYAPYLLIQDPSSTSPGATRYIPPGASVLGLYANTDTLAGVQQVAAGTLYGQIAAEGLEVQFAPTDLDTLAQNNINAIKNIPGVGYCVFGGRTLLQGYPDQYISVRRVLMKLEHDCVELMDPYLFQPNGPDLWASITTVLGNYLTEQTGAGLFSSSDVTQAYTLVCDTTNNTTATAQAGLVNVNIGVALASPAEFIYVQIQQLNGTTTVTSSTTATG